MTTRTANMFSSRQLAAWSVYGVIAAWLAAVAIASWWITRYQFTTIDAPSAKFAEHWPTSSHLPRRPNHSTLVLFLHPKCPCSRASLGELDRLFTSLVGQSDGRLDFVVDATVPVDSGEDWLQTDTLQYVKHMANARVFVDQGGKEAAAFGATTSGFVMLFDERGSRQYAGGVTESRGHEGDNTGSCSLHRILCHEAESADGIPAFGCQLCLPDSGRRTAAIETGAM